MSAVLNTPMPVEEAAEAQMIDGFHLVIDVSSKWLEVAKSKNGL